MKRYQEDPDVPSHLRKLLDSARLDELDAARRKRVAARLGLVPLLVTAPGLAAGDGGAGGAEGGAAGGSSAGVSGAGALATSATAAISGPSAVGSLATGATAAISAVPRPRLTLATIAGAVALIGAASAVSVFSRDAQPTVDEASPRAAATTAAPASATEAAVVIAPPPPPPTARARESEPILPSLSVAALPDVKPVPGEPARAKPALALAAASPASTPDAGGATTDTATPTTAGDLRAELVALEAVRGATAAGKPDEALRQLEHYRASFPEGKLREEAAVLRIEALADHGDSVEARAAADRLLRDSPHTVYAARVRAAALRASREPAQ